MLKTKDFRIDVSEPILSETFRVLRDKFEWDGHSIHSAWLRLLATCNCVLPTETLNVIPDETDNRILECAVTAQSDFIVSEDKDLLRIKQFAGIRIVLIGEFYSEIS